MTPVFRLVARLLIVWAFVVSFHLAASAAWNEKVLYRFKNIPDGAVPVGQIVFDQAGNLLMARLSGLGTRAALEPRNVASCISFSRPLKKAGDGKRTFSTRSRARTAMTEPGPRADC